MQYVLWTGDHKLETLLTSPLGFVTSGLASVYGVTVPANTTTPQMVTLPAARRGMFAAFSIAWARSLGEFGPILVFAGATRLKTEVLPTSVFIELSVGRLEAAVAVSLLMGIILLAKSIGSRMGVDDVGIADSTAVGGAALTVGKYLSPRLYLSYGVGLFTPGEVVTLRYRLTRLFNVEIQNGTLSSRAGLNYRIEK